jgi:hypothetical protein
MKGIRNSLAGAALAVAATVSLTGMSGTVTAAAGGNGHPVVVELFTSQGCYSCPPADKYVGVLKQRDDVIALAFHIDYWDYIGWKDRFASARPAQSDNAPMARPWGFGRSIRRKW